MMFRTSPSACRLPGSRDTSALVYSDRTKAANRRYLHEFASAHRALDLKHILTEDQAGAPTASTEIGRTVKRSIDVWLDTVEHLQQHSNHGEISIEPSAVLNALREQEADRDREAPDSLIYRIARDDHGRFTALCANPRVMLRRERQLCPIGRVRELDPSCMRWLDMQPGRTIAEKAGAKQRIRSVVRVRSVATLENRVLRDLLLRACGAGVGYVRQNSMYVANNRVDVVKRFAEEMKNALRTTDVATVPELSGIPTPNYVLQNDRRYRYVWQTWIQLVRKQQITQSLLWWGGRWCSELAFLGALEALEAWEGASATFSHRVTWRREAQHGEFFEAAAPVGSYVQPSNRGPIVIDVVRSAQVARGVWPSAWENWTRLVPDFAIVPRTGSVKPLLVWSLVVCDDQQDQHQVASVNWLDKTLGEVGVRAVVFKIGGASSRTAHTHLRLESIDRVTTIPQRMSKLVSAHLRGEPWNT